MDTIAAAAPTKTYSAGELLYSSAGPSDRPSTCGTWPVT